MYVDHETVTLSFIDWITRIAANMKNSELKKKPYHHIVSSLIDDVRYQRKTLLLAENEFIEHYVSTNQ